MLEERNTERETHIRIIHYKLVLIEVHCQGNASEKESLKVLVGSRSINTQEHKYIHTLTQMDTQTVQSLALY